ncbi:hypothetical protein Bca52824_084508 [Brassica carinata]|uniref:Uncharacterized protein n=1 Tax=Brassica carinata TaxID=52824 RepID=A0A8X7TU31_BRACI|nr:hypothetical protein Bca52824_084508 [Brassica carinata]
MYGRVGDKVSEVRGAATKGLGERKASDSTEVASRKSMVDAIEREFEGTSIHSSL